MSKRQPPLPKETILKYETVEGTTPTIEVVINLTTQGQVEYLINRLESLKLLLPAARARSKPKPKSSRPTARRTDARASQPDAHAEE